jgi:hypothetical protein
MPFHCFDQDSVQLIVIQAQPEEVIAATELFPTVNVSELDDEFA